MIANLQYGWTLFLLPIDTKYHRGRAAIQAAFSIFVLTETWLVPIESRFVDRFGPKAVVLIGGIPARPQPPAVGATRLSGLVHRRPAFDDGNRIG